MRHSYDQRDIAVQGGAFCEDLPLGNPRKKPSHSCGHCLVVYIFFLFYVCSFVLKTCTASSSMNEYLRVLIVAIAYSAGRKGNPCFQVNTAF